MRATDRPWLRTPHMEAGTPTDTDESSAERARDFFGAEDSSDLLDLLIDETAASLSLLSDFQLGEPAADDAVQSERPQGASVEVAFRFGFSIGGRARMGILSMPLPDILSLADSLLMLPTADIEKGREESAPNEGQKEAILEAGNLIGGAFAGALGRRLTSENAVQFFGCQGVAQGKSPWISGHTGEPLAIRRHGANFGSFAPFTVTLAIPV